jgi:spore germination protein GerM
MRGPRHGRGAPVAAGLATVITLALAGCGVPVNRSPAALPRNGVPFGLLQPSSRSTTTTTALPSVQTTVQIFLVSTSTGRLVGVNREVPEAEESLAAVLGQLVKGPTNAEAAAGLESAVPTQTVVVGATIGTDEIATVNLGGTFGQLVGQPLIQAVAQVVFTAAAALPGVSGVTFELAGQVADVPAASGAQVRVANPADFVPLAPLPVTGTGTGTGTTGTGTG